MQRNGIVQHICVVSARVPVGRRVSANESNPPPRAYLWCCRISVSSRNKPREDNEDTSCLVFCRASLPEPLSE